MDDEAIRQRRNLVVLSMALTLYYLIGGEVEILGRTVGDIPIAQPLAWLAILFFVWRHWVHAKEDRAHSRNAFMLACRESPQLNTLGTQRLREHYGPLLSPDQRQDALTRIETKTVDWSTSSWFRYSCGCTEASGFHDVANKNIVNIGDHIAVPWSKAVVSVWILRVRLATTTSYIDPWLPYAAPLLGLGAFVNTLG